jgi:hypothetical protein
MTTASLDASGVAAGSSAPVAGTATMITTTAAQVSRKRMRNEALLKSVLCLM